MKVVLKSPRCYKMDKKSFEMMSSKGIHLTFPNGWTVSIQFGPGSYCDNYDLIRDRSKWDGLMKSNNAEVWCWNSETHYPEEPLAEQSIEDVLKLLNKISKKKKVL